MNATSPPTAEVLLRIRLAEGLDPSDLADLSTLTGDSTLDETVSRVLKAGLRALKATSARNSNAKRKGAAK